MRAPSYRSDYSVGGYIVFRDVTIATFAEKILAEEFASGDPEKYKAFEHGVEWCVSRYEKVASFVTLADADEYVAFKNSKVGALVQPAQPSLAYVPDNDAIWASAAAAVGAGR